MKPRLTYAQFRAMQQQKPTVASVIRLFIEDAAAPGMKPIGQSQMCILKVIARSPFAATPAAEITKAGVIDFAKWLRTERPGRHGKPIGPATALQYMTYLYVALQTVADTHEEHEGLLTTAIPRIKSAKRRLMKMQLIAQSNPRKVVPTPEQFDRICEAARERDKSPRAKIKLLMLILVGVESTRRLAELCRWKRSQVEWDHVDAKGNPAPRYMIEAVKHPTKKATNHRWFPLTPNLAELLKLVPEVPGEDRFFPFNSKSTSQAYAALKRQLGITGLVFHDMRRWGTTKWIALLKGNLHAAARINGDTVQVLEKHYDAAGSEVVFHELAAIARERGAPAAAHLL